MPDICHLYLTRFLCALKCLILAASHWDYVYPKLSFCLSVAWPGTSDISNISLRLCLFNTFILSVSCTSRFKMSDISKISLRLCLFNTFIVSVSHMVSFKMTDISSISATLCLFNAFILSVCCMSSFINTSTILWLLYCLRRPHFCHTALTYFDWN